MSDADAAAGAPLWDSGDVASSNCSQIVYGGKALAPFTRYAWTVSWTSSAGAKSPAASTVLYYTWLYDERPWLCFTVPTSGL